MVRLVTNSLGPCVVCHKPVYLGDVPFFYIPDENGGSAWHGECRVWLPLDVQEVEQMPEPNSTTGLGVIGSYDGVWAPATGDSGSSTIELPQPRRGLRRAIGGWLQRALPLWFMIPAYLWLLAWAGMAFYSLFYLHGVAGVAMILVSFGMMALICFLVICVGFITLEVDGQDYRFDRQSGDYMP